MTCLSAMDCQSTGRNRKQKPNEIRSTKRRKTSGGRNTVTTMNHHISNCDRDYLHSAHIAPHKQWPLLMENIKPDRFTHLTHASLLQHQFPTAASPLGLTQSTVPVTGWAEQLQLTAASSGSLGHHQPHPYEGLQSPHQQLLSLPCTGSSNNWEPSWPKGFKTKFSSCFQRCCKPCQCSIPGLAVSSVLWK